MVKVSRFEIEFTEPKLFYRAGEAIKGNLILDLKDVLKINKINIKLSGICVIKESHMTTKHRREQRKKRLSKGNALAVKVEHKHKTNLTQEWTLPTQILVGAAVLQPGVQRFPYVFNVPYDWPSSLPESSDAFTGPKFELEARIDIPQLPDIKKFLPVVLQGVHDLNKEPGLGKPVIAEDELRVGGCIGGRGLLSCRVVLNKGGFIAGQAMQIKVDVDNSSSSPVSNVELRVWQTMRQTGVEHKHIKKDILWEKDVPFQPVLKNGEKSFTQDLTLPKCYDFLKACHLVEIDHCVEVNLVRPGWDLTVYAPFMVGTVALGAKPPPVITLERPKVRINVFDISAIMMATKRGADIDTHEPAKEAGMSTHIAEKMRGFANLSRHHVEEHHEHPPHPLAVDEPEPKSPTPPPIPRTPSPELDSEEEERQRAERDANFNKYRGAWEPPSEDEEHDSYYHRRYDD